MTGIGSFWHWIVVGVILLLLFGGRGKVSELMGDFAKGIKSFKKGMQEDDGAHTEPAKTDPRTIEHQSGAPTDLKRRAETETKFEGSTS